MARRSRPASASSGASCTVKVENLSKESSEAGLKGKLEQYGAHILSLRVINVPDSPVNYAYINCSDWTTASSIVDSLNQKVLLDSKLLTAKIKEQGAGHKDSQGATGHSGYSQGTAGHPGYSQGTAGHPGYSQGTTGHRGYVSTSRGRGSIGRGCPYPATGRPGHGSAHSIGGRDVCTVKVLISDDRASRALSGEDLDRHFSQFGELSSPCKIRLGNPNYAYVNFSDPLAAQDARRGPAHIIQGAVLTTVPASRSSSNPFPEAQRMARMACSLPSQPPTGSKRWSGAEEEFLHSRFECDALAGHYIKEDVERFLEERQLSLETRVALKGGGISVFAKRGVAAEIDRFVRSRIGGNEAKISTRHLSLECYYLPVLADQLVRAQLGKMQVPLELKVGLSAHSTSLEQLGQAYSKCAQRGVEAKELAQYVQPAKGEEFVRHVWSWRDDDGFKPYDTALSKKLERAFRSGEEISESIGRFTYEIDTSSMEQTNLRTNRTREIRRRAVTERAPKKWKVPLWIRAHSELLQAVESGILEELERHVVETEVPIEDEDPEPLLELARRSFVGAELAGDCSGTILLKGEEGVVTGVAVQLKDRILTRKLEVARLEMASLPRHWEPQSDKCVLKALARGSAEWNRVEQRMLGPGFRATLLRVERIQNLWLWEVYERSRKRMSTKNGGKVNEKELFHGTRSVAPVKIYKSEQGFDSRLSSRGMWGEGAYFADKAAYSNNYCHTTPEGYRQIFLVQVITGITYRCSPDRSLKVPPLKSDHSSSSLSIGHAHKDSMFEDERFDSVSGHTSGSDVFIIYEHGKVYPAYLITYKSA